jgi:hypothetical protein
MEEPSPLTALSTEVLQMIIEECIPEGFEALSLTCHAVHEASRRYIPNYQRLKERFHKISYSDGEPPEPEDNRNFWKALPGNPLAHLLELTCEPLAFRYVEVADLEYRDHSARWFTPTCRTEVEHEFIDEMLDVGDLFHVLRSSISRNDFYSSAEIYNPNWFDIVLEETVHNVDYATTCLLSLLSNVKHLNLRFTHHQYLNADELYDSEPERMWTFLSAIGSNANNLIKPSAGLSKLVSLSISGGCVHQNESVKSYLPLFTIDSLKTLFLHALVLSEDKSWPECPSISVFGKNLECLYLTDCVIPEGDTWEGCLASLLSRTPKLKTLRLHPRKLEDDSRSFNVPKVINVIAEHLGQSLEEFSLSGVLQPGRPSGFVPGHASMKGFKLLQQVELDVRGFRPGGPWRFPSLVQLLPASIMNVDLLLTGFISKDPEQMCNTTMEVLHGLFKGFDSEVETKLPNLEEVTFRGLLTDEFFKWLEQFDESTGVSMDIQQDRPAPWHML